jgi:hypothetical protein
MNRILAIVFSISCLCWLKCGQDGNPAAFGKGDNINFHNLAVGQRNRYVSFTIADDTVKTYGRDTAIVEITDTISGGFVFYAGFSPGSQSYVAFPPGPRYGIRVIHDTCNATWLDGNNLFLSQLLPPQDFPLSYPVEGTVAFKDLSPTFCNIIINQSFNKITFDGKITGCIVAGNYFDTLNIVVTNAAAFSGGPGYAYIFSKSHGFMYTMSYSASPTTSKTASGWEMLPF